MASLTLNALKKAPLLDQDGADITAPAFTAVSSDTAIVSLSFPGYKWHAIGVSAGVASVTVTRVVDGASKTHDIEVIAAVPFDWSLGTESPA